MTRHGSDEVVRLLEPARQQRKFEPVLEAVLHAQSQWAMLAAKVIMMR